MQWSAVETQLAQVDEQEAQTPFDAKVPTVQFCTQALFCKLSPGTQDKQASFPPEVQVLQVGLQVSHLCETESP